MDPITLALLGIAGVLLLWGTYRRPELWLACGSVLKFAGGGHLVFSQVGSVLILLAAGLALIMQGRDRLLPRSVAAVAVLLPLYLAARTYATVGGEDPTQFIMCAVAALTAAWCAQAGRPMVWALALAGLMFLALSTALGESDPTGNRFQGISGNPNRFVAPVLLTTPFIAHVTFRSKRLSVTVAGLVVLGLLGSTVLSTRSSQGVAALVVILAGCAYTWVRRSPTRFLPAFLGTLAVAGLAWRYRSAFEFSADEEDAGSWSGRTPIFLRAWQVIQDNPVLGIGVPHFDAGELVERSSHNVTLSIGVMSGFPGMIAWICLVLSAMVVGLRRMATGDYWAVVVPVVAVLSLTQTLEMMPLVWVMLAFVVSWHPERSRVSVARLPEGARAASGATAVPRETGGFHAAQI